MNDDSLTRSSPTEEKSARPVAGIAGEACLSVVCPPELAGRIELSGGTTVIGRDRNAPVGRIRHETVSRRHLEVRWDRSKGAHVALDLESRNGSWLDGRPLGAEPTRMRDGSVLRLGSVVAVYEALGEPVDGPRVADAILGGSPAVARLRHDLVKMAADSSPVLVTGETGVGKEHVVRALHQESGRAGPLVAVNVSELSAQLVESQLFGHTQGAFTGAGKAQPGLFREADGGTLFLDEIGELPLELQPKLLRVVQEQRVRAVGGTKDEPVDVRVVAATNRDLAREVERGTFRRDLLARLSLLELRVPPLAERRADIPIWIDALHRRWCEERGRTYEALDFDSRAVEALLLMEWPDNLRGLDRLVHRLALGAGGAGSDPEELAAIAGSAPAAADDEGATEPERPEKVRRPAPESAEALAEALARHDGSVRATARWYGRDRRQIYRWMKSFGIGRDDG